MHRHGFCAIIDIIRKDHILITSHSVRDPILNLNEVYFMYLCVEEYANESVVRFSVENKRMLKDLIMAEETKYGFDEARRSWINQYDFDDYLYIANIVREARGMYHQNHFNPMTGGLIDGYKPIPYIHVELYEEAVSADKYLNAGVCGPDVNGCYTLKLNRYLLFRYIHFLQDIFDKNLEEVIESDELKNAVKSQPMVTKLDLITLSHSFLASGEKQSAEAYEAFAEMISEEIRVHRPVPTYLGSKENSTFNGLLYYDQKRDALVSDVKKKIYSTSGFAKYYRSRNDLISEIFDKSMKMLVMHEFSHIANGHCQLSQKDPLYANQKRVRICLEQNADDTAMRWLIDNILYETEDGNPESTVLRFNKNELISELSLIVFSAYLILSWGYTNDERIWDNSTLQNYIDDGEIKHPLYQFRTFHIVNRSLKFIYDILTIHQCGYPNDITTSDGFSLNSDLFSTVCHETMDLLNSFESSFQLTLNEEEYTEMKSNSWKLERKSMPGDVQSVPFLMPVFFINAGKEKEAIDSSWAEIRNRLVASGAYSNLLIES